MRLFAQSVLAAPLGALAMTMWSSPVDADNSIETVESVYSSGTSLALDGAGNPVISYDDASNEDLKVAHCNDPNCEGGDESIVTVDSAGRVGQYSSLVLDGAGNPVISYTDHSNEDLKLVHCNDPNCAVGGESIVAVDSAGDLGFYTSLVLDAAGNPVISYHDGGNGTLKVAHCNDANCAGGDESIETVDGPAVGTDTSLVLDAAGNPVISYARIGDGIANGGLKLAHCDDAACAGGNESIVTVDSASYLSEGTSLVLDATGGPVVSYFDHSNQDLKLAHCDDPNCVGAGESVVTVDGAGSVGINSSLELDASGHPVLSYYDQTNGDLKVAVCNDANCAGGNERIAAVDRTDDDVGFDTSLALDATGKPVITYRDSSNDRLKLAHCDTVDCIKVPPTCLGVAATIVGTAGDEELTGTAGPDVIFAGDGDDTINGLAGDDLLCGGEGSDTVTYASATAQVSANLAMNTATGDGNDRFDSVENLVGSPLRDVINGNGEANTILGGGGADIITALPGNDIVQGGSGNDLVNGGDGDDEVVGDGDNDTVIGGPGNDHLIGADGIDVVAYTATHFTSVSVNLATNTATGDGEDVLDSFENVIGTQLSDVLTGDDGANRIEGNGGNDEIHGAAGDDNLIGGAGDDVIGGSAGNDTIAGEGGVDQASFADAPAAVIANLASATGDGNDRLTGVENLSGSSFDDQLTGDAGANTLAGGDGGDQIVGQHGDDHLLGDGGFDTLGGGPGNDRLVGGDDTDRVLYASSPAAITASLTTNTATGEGADVFDSVEELLGSQFDDVLVGSSANNAILGLNGHDQLDGAAGDDDVRGGPGDDVLAGGPGGDLLAGEGGVDTLTYEGSSAAVTVDLARGGAIGEGIDGLLLVETVRGSHFDDKITGDAGIDTLWGGDGDDEINGLNGDDRLFGEGGADTINGGAGDDSAEGGDGDDEIGDLDTINGDAGDDLLDGAHGDDHLSGGLGNDRLLGGDTPIGDDVLDGGPGDDFLAGEGGVDTVTFARSEAAVLASLTSNVAVGDGIDEVYVENLVGSPFNDVLIGDGGINTIQGLAGADLVLGGAGVDTASYATAPSAVNANLTTNTASGGDGQDELATIEHLTGSAFDDTLIGNAAPNVLRGGNGNDALNGVAGNDQLNGGNGADTATYATAPSAVSANLTTNKASGGAGNDRFVALEHLTGSRFTDVLVGNAGVNTIQGGNGNDRLSGVAGNDRLAGGNGNDRLYGWAGNDALFGQAGSDALNCGANFDTADGGSGADSQTQCEVVAGIR